ncbi:uncharacterized protein LOC127081395 [Lathyrus oleraceus]|uniref:uncharacterized protein LOC127081395 n=1 Tax=Pisum sativum TaxID=3888 RepID=UPI0021D0B42B|nr:uncharacterized protein LOC127081395 [Pisum sativum]
MSGESEVIGSGGGSPPRGNNNNDESTSDSNNYVARPPTFNEDSTEFEWWKTKMHTHIIGIDDNLWDILEDGINIQVNSVGMISDRKYLTPSQKKLYIKHHRVRGIFVDALPHYEYIKIIDKSTTHNIFKSTCVAYEGNHDQQVREAKANVLVHRYGLFKTKDDEDIESMLSRFKILVSGLQVLYKSYTSSDHSLLVKFRPKVTTIQEAKDLNTLSLESLIKNLQSHEMDLNGYEPFKKSKSLALKSFEKFAKDIKIWNSKEASQSEAFEEDSIVMR